MKEIKPKQIPPPLVKVYKYAKTGPHEVFVLNEYEFTDLLVQIKEYYEGTEEKDTDWYFMNNGKKVFIKTNGNSDSHPEILDSQIDRLLKLL